MSIDIDLKIECRVKADPGFLVRLKRLTEHWLVAEFSVTERGDGTAALVIKAYNKRDFGEDIMRDVQRHLAGAGDGAEMLRPFGMVSVDWGLTCLYFADGREVRIDAVGQSQRIEDMEVTIRTFLQADGSERTVGAALATG